MPTPVRYTATLTIGRYADWLNGRPEFISPLLNYVVTGLSTKDEVRWRALVWARMHPRCWQLVSASSLAFKHVCDGCARHLTGREALGALFKVRGPRPAALAHAHLHSKRAGRCAGVQLQLIARPARPEGDRGGADAYACARPL